MSSKILVIGIDGGTFNVLGPLMAQGHLPNLSKIAAEGVKGELASVIPPITGPAWASFMTGKNPGKHGVFEFIKRDREGRDYPINSAEVKSDTLWEILSGYGKRVAVINVPVTYPPRKINGVLVADFLTPKGKRDFAYPEGLLEEIENLFGPYRLYIEQVYSKGKVEDVLKELFEVLEYRKKSVKYLLNKADWDFFMVHIWGTDRLQHELWHIIDPAHPYSIREEYATYNKEALRYYEEVDAAVGEFIACAGEDAHIFIISDHGFGPVEKFLNFNVWLLESGYLKLKKKPMTFLKYLLFKAGITPTLGYKLAMRLGIARLRLSKGVADRVKQFRTVNRLFLSLDDVDWLKTAAYSKGNYGQLFLNKKGREPQGVIGPEGSEKFTKEIASRLKEIKDPDTGEAIIGPVYRREDLYQGEFAEEAPDITFLAADMKYKALGSVDFATNRFIEKVYGNSGDHRMEGIFLARSILLKKGKGVQNAKIIDVSPTILHIMGLPIPDDMDGAVLTDIFEPEYLEEHPVVHSPAKGGSDHGQRCSIDEEDRDIMERLRKLGYV